MTEEETKYTPKTVKDVDAHEFVRQYSKHLKGKLTPMENHDMIKTGCYKELSPNDPDWYFVRAASVARKIYLKQGIGIGKFRKIYGSTYRKGVRTEHFCKVSGGLIRHICQQLEKAGLVQLYSKGGRQITSAGMRDLDLIAGRCPTPPAMTFV
jgi:small subunit ribosomal protein S19e